MLDLLWGWSLPWTRTQQTTLSGKAASKPHIIPLPAVGVGPPARDIWPGRACGRGWDRGGARVQVKVASAACVAECVSVSWDRQLAGEWQPVHRRALRSLRQGIRH